MQSSSFWAMNMMKQKKKIHSIMVLHLDYDDFWNLIQRSKSPYYTVKERDSCIYFYHKESNNPCDWYISPKGEIEFMDRYKTRALCQ